MFHFFNSFSYFTTKSFLILFNSKIKIRVSGYHITTRDETKEKIKELLEPVFLQIVDLVDADIKKATRPGTITSTIEEITIIDED